MLWARTIRARRNGKRLGSRTRATVQRTTRDAPAGGWRDGYFWVLSSIWTVGVIISLGWICLWALAQPQMLAVLVGHSVLWLIGLAAIRFVDSRLVSEHDARLVGERYVSEIRERLRVASEIQRTFLPSVAPTIPGFDVGAIWSPADDVAGDFFDYVPMQHGNWGILIADVSGHGIDGALLMAEICAYIRAQEELHQDVGQLLTRVNRLLSRQNSACRFATCFFVRLDPGQHSFVYANAGHEGYLLHRNGEVRVLASTVPPLGLLPGLVLKNAEAIPLIRGEVLLLLTDGVWEATRSDGNSFGFQRACDLVHANCFLSAQQIAEKLLDAICEYTQRRDQDDDITAVVVKVN